MLNSITSICAAVAEAFSPAVPVAAQVKTRLRDRIPSYGFDTIHEQPSSKVFNCSITYLASVFFEGNVTLSASSAVVQKTRRKKSRLRSQNDVLLLL
jgi:hypothetical protein